MSTDPDDFDEGPPCPRCYGDRVVNCYCGGDQCYCENHGERNCPLCYGEGVASPKRAEAYLENEREMGKVMLEWWKSQIEERSDEVEAAGSESQHDT
jgi:hypothetical protein